MKKFLVIDDNSNRKNKYSLVFNFLELDFAFSSKEFLEKVSNKYDGYFVDIIYEDEQFKEFSFQQILEKLPDKKPLFIISEHWTRAMDGLKMAYLRNSEKYYNVLGYLSWNIIELNDEGEIVKDFVRQQINNYYDVAFGAFEDNQAITILQISDLEFGNPSQEDNIEFTRAELKSKIRKILRKLNINSGKVDFICICGDIAYKGEKSEYEKAKKWLKSLGEEILVNEIYENILIVPGNHDFNFNAACGNFYKYDNGEYKLREDNVIDYNEHGIYNFGKFVYEINGDKSYIIEPYKPIIKKTYQDYGINFILLNPIKIDREKRFSYGLSDNELKYLLEDGFDIEETGVCNIVLSHLAADKYSMIDPTADGTNRDIRNIVDELDIKGWLEGHAHDDVHVDDIRIGSHKVLISRTNSLMLKNVERCEGAGNGFTILKLYRENNKVVNISYYDEKMDKEIDYKNLFSE